MSKRHRIDVGDAYSSKRSRYMRNILMFKITTHSL